jgi:hypothetical protein
MFRIRAITRVGVIAVVCVAVAAPQALAKSAAKGGKAKVVKVQSVKKVASGNGDRLGLRASLSSAYAQGCENGNVPDRTMGGDNMNYEYFGDVCTGSGSVQSLTGLAARVQAAASATAGSVVSEDNTNYEYYGHVGG